MASTLYIWWISMNKPPSDCLAVGGVPCVKDSLLYSFLAVPVAGLYALL
jgi:hypothetical protein